MHMNFYTYINKKKIFKQKISIKKNHNKKYFNDTNINLGYNTLKINTCIHNTLKNTICIGKKNNTFVLNLKTIKNYLIKALQFFLYIFKNKGKILIVNTNPEISKLTYNLKKKSASLVFMKNIYFIDICYTKGNLTNYKKIFFNIKMFINFYIYYNNFLNYNKIHFNTYKKMKNNYKGFISKNYIFKKKQKIDFNDKNLKPDLIILLSTINVSSIINEACSLNIPIIGFIEKNTSMEKITYPIPNNIYYYAVIIFFFKFFFKIIDKYKKF